MGHPGSSVDWILQQSRRYPLLTPEQEITLARHVQDWQAIKDVEDPSRQQQAVIKRGRRARDRFFLSNIRLAVKVAARYQKYSGTLTLEDLIQEGLIGLDSAIIKFDPALGYKFSTYSYWWIRQGITRSMNRDGRLIHIPVGANDVIRKAVDYMHEQVRLTGKMPSLDEVAAYTKVQRQTLINYLNHNASVMSLDQRINSDDAHSDFIDIVADPRSVEPQPEDLELYNDSLHEAIGELSPTQQHVIKARYFPSDGRPRPFMQLGREMEVTRQATQQMHDRALTSLRLRLGVLQGQACIQALQSA